MTLAYDTSTNLKYGEEEEAGQRPAELHETSPAVAHDAMSYLALAAERASQLLVHVPDSRLRDELACVAQGIRSAYMVLDESSAVEFAEPPPADVATAVRRTVRLLRPWLLSNTVRTRGLEETPRVAVAQGDLQRLLHNLVLNAREEVGRRGGITVEAKVLDTIPGGRYGEDVPVACVRISVGDNGRGLLSADVARAFWTSTSRSSDTPARGLAIAYSIVRAAGGRIEVEAHRDVGTRVHCYLPVAVEGA